MQEGQALVQALVQLGSRPNLVSLRPSILRWMATLNPALVAATFDICASLQLSMDDSTVALVLRDAAQAVQVCSADPCAGRTWMPVPDAVWCRRATQLAWPL